MDVEQIDAMGKWVVLLSMLLLLGLLAAFIIFGNVREQNSYGLHEIIGGLLTFTGLYGGQALFRGRKNGAPVAPPTPVAGAPVTNVPPAPGLSQQFPPSAGPKR